MCRCNKVIDRNLVVINEMRRVLSGEIVVEKGKKPVKPQDLVRLFENIIQVPMTCYGIFCFTIADKTKCFLSRI